MAAGEAGRTGGTPIDPPVHEIRDPTLRPADKNLAPARRRVHRTGSGYIGTFSPERTGPLGAILMKQRQIDAAAVMGAVLAHPTRLQILDFVGNARQASPALYSERSGKPLPNCDYHFAALLEADCLVRSENRADGGGISDLYRLAPLGQRLLQLTADL